ncbi:MAG TPA: VOC family protein [Pirellulales bacterium]
MSHSMPEPLAFAALHHVSFAVRDLARSIAFYRDVLGAKRLVRPEMRTPGAWLFLGGVQIHLIASGESANGTGNAPTEIRSTHDHIAFLVHDLSAVEKKLAAHDVEYRINIQGGSGLRQVFFHDPEGRVIEAAEYPPTPPEMV